MSYVSYIRNWNVFRNVIQIPLLASEENTDLVSLDCFSTSRQGRDDDHSGKAYEGRSTCRIPRQNGDGHGRRLGKKKNSHSVCRGLCTWNVLSGEIHGGIRNIQCKSRLRGTFHRCTIAPRKNIFWRGCFVFMFCRCRGYLYLFTRVPGIFTRVPALYKGAWFVSHFHYRVFHRTLVAQTRQQTCEREFCNEKLCFMSEQLRCIHLILCEIAGTS